MVIFSGLGPVLSLSVEVATDAIFVSWKPPDVATELSYRVLYYRPTSPESTTEVKTQDLFLRIPATQGDEFSITVTPFIDSATGESSNITAAVDCEYI